MYVSKVHCIAISWKSCFSANNKVYPVTMFIEYLMVIET